MYQYLIKSVQRHSVDGSHCDILCVVISEIMSCSFWSGTAPPVTVIVVPTKVWSYGPEREETQQLKVLSYVLCKSIKAMQSGIRFFGTYSVIVRMCVQIGTIKKFHDTPIKRYYVCLVQGVQKFNEIVM